MQGEVSGIQAECEALVARGRDILDRLTGHLDPELVAFSEMCLSILRQDAHNARLELEDVREARLGLTLTELRNIVREIETHAAQLDPDTLAA